MSILGVFSLLNSYHAMISNHIQNRAVAKLPGIAVLAA